MGSDSQDIHGDYSSDKDSDNMNQGQHSINIAVLVVTLYICTGAAQDDFGGGDDAGADMDLESMTGGDGGGQDTKNAANNKKLGEKSFSEESILALQQLGVIIGVCFMVGSLFMLIVGVEILCGKVEEKYQEMTGKSHDIEKDPAA